MHDAGYRRIPITSKGETFFALVDAGDYDEMRQHNWFLSRYGYAVRNAGGRFHFHQRKMHREVLGLVPHDGKIADHINRDKLDNRRSNLRVVTAKENSRNITNQQGRSSQHRGVSWRRQRGKWTAEAKFDRVYHYLGIYASEDDAASAVNAFWVERGYPAPNEV